jgi:hypothetical protein
MGPASVINSSVHAWMEGFADFFSQAVPLADPSANLRGDGIVGSTISNLEGVKACGSLPPLWYGSPITGEMIENNIATALWDLVDQPGDPGSSSEVADTISRRDSEVIQIFDHELGAAGALWPDIYRFRNAWIARGLPAAALDGILALNGIPLPATAPSTSGGPTSPPYGDAKDPCLKNSHRPCP